MTTRASERRGRERGADRSTPARTAAQARSQALGFGVVIEVAAAAGVATWVTPTAAHAAAYRVGPGVTHRQLRGLRDGSGARNTLELQGDHDVVENLDVSGGTFRHIDHHAHDVTIRDMVVRDRAAHGVPDADSDSGSLTPQRVAVDRTGAGDREHPFDATVVRPFAVLESVEMHGSAFVRQGGRPAARDRGRVGDGTFGCAAAGVSRRHRRGNTGSAGIIWLGMKLGVAGLGRVVTPHVRSMGRRGPREHAATRQAAGSLR
jgi:hypothetical protein